VSALAQHGFWIASRAAGVVALLCASGAVAAGVALGGRLLRVRTGDLRVAHEALSLAALAALAVHALALLGDSFLHPTVADLLVPFASPYQRWWMAAGIIGAWLLAILGLSAFARRRIGVERWRRIHRWAALGWLLGLAHSIGQGTDAGTAWFLVSTAIVAVPALALLARRMLASPTPAAR
jgi:sulfoxide reductase heme-binding subunit YedZ